MCKTKLFFLVFFVGEYPQAHFGVADAVSSRAARAGGEGGARVESACGHILTIDPPLRRLYLREFERRGNDVASRSISS